MRGLALTSLVAVAGCGIGSYNEFRDQLAARWCDHAGPLRRGRRRRSATALLGAGAAFADGARRRRRADRDRRAPHDSPPRQRRGVPRRRSSRRRATRRRRARTSTATATAWSPAASPTAPPAGATTSAWAASASRPTAAAPAPPYAPPGGACVPTGGTPDVTCDPSVQLVRRRRHLPPQGPEGRRLRRRRAVHLRLRLRGRKVRRPAARHPRQRLHARRDPLRRWAPTATPAASACRWSPRARRARKRTRASPASSAAGGTCAPWLDAGGACNASPSAIASGCPATQTCVMRRVHGHPGAEGRPARPVRQRRRLRRRPLLRHRQLLLLRRRRQRGLPGRPASRQADLQCVSGACHAPRLHHVRVALATSVAISPKSSNGTHAAPRSAQRALQQRAAHGEERSARPMAQRSLAPSPMNTVARARRRAPASQTLALAHGAAPARRARRAESPTSMPPSTKRVAIEPAPLERAEPRAPSKASM